MPKDRLCLLWKKRQALVKSERDNSGESKAVLMICMLEDWSRRESIFLSQLPNSCTPRMMSPRDCFGNCWVLRNFSLWCTSHSLVYICLLCLWVHWGQGWCLVCLCFSVDSWEAKHSFWTAHHRCHTSSQLCTFKYFSLWDRKLYLGCCLGWLPGVYSGGLGFTLSVSPGAWSGELTLSVLGLTA